PRLTSFSACGEGGRSRAFRSSFAGRRVVALAVTVAGSRSDSWRTARPGRDRPVDGTARGRGAARAGHDRGLVDPRVPEPGDRRPPAFLALHPGRSSRVSVPGAVLQRSAGVPRPAAEP